MRILVLSDSHRSVAYARMVFEKLKDEIQAVIHLGDCFNDMDYFKQKYSKMEFYNIIGNCDFVYDEPTEKIIVIKGKKFLITHGHTFGVKSTYDRIVYRSCEIKADVCLFGHTHQPTLFHDYDTMFMNPGSIAMPRGGSDLSYGVIDINDGKIDLKLQKLI